MCCYLWVDCVVSVWLIQCFIDLYVCFVWLDNFVDCLFDVFGFDFDGVLFMYVGDCVLFEVLVVSFGFGDNDGFVWLGVMVYVLDVGGVIVLEVGGFEVIFVGV